MGERSKCAAFPLRTVWSDRPHVSFFSPTTVTDFTIRENESATASIITAPVFTANPVLSIAVFPVLQLLPTSRNRKRSDFPTTGALCYVFHRSPGGTTRAGDCDCLSPINRSRRVWVVIWVNSSRVSPSSGCQRTRRGKIGTTAIFPAHALELSVITSRPASPMRLERP